MPDKAPFTNVRANYLDPIEVRREELYKKVQSAFYLVKQVCCIEVGHSLDKDGLMQCADLFVVEGLFKASKELKQSLTALNNVKNPESIDA